MYDVFGVAALLSSDVSSTNRFVIALGLCVLALTLLFGLARAHQRRLCSIPIRIHVAGTRGKSATVRLIAAAFREGGYHVMAKTTGTEPRLIYPDGLERPIRRWGSANVGEQRRFVTAARRAGANVIVAEAMAIQPEYLHALEHGYIQATELVITNTYPDHAEDLGPSPDAMAAAVAHCLPRGRRVFLGSDVRDTHLLARAAELGCEIIHVETSETEPLQVNLALARAVAKRYGISTGLIEEAFGRATNDPGSFRMATLDAGHMGIQFANAFSCNDPTSFERLWRSHQPALQGSAFFLNPRSDRPLRTVQFLSLLARLAPDAPLFITARNPMLRRIAVAKGFRPGQVHLIGASVSTDSLRTLASKLTAGTVLWGVGNYKGAGAQLTARLKAAGATC